MFAFCGRKPSFLAEFHVLLFFLLSYATCKHWEAWTCFSCCFDAITVVELRVRFFCGINISWYDKFALPLEDIFEQYLGLACDYRYVCLAARAAL